jgi:23S rRNA pseudouridine1911/1915/1917 synthase
MVEFVDEEQSTEDGELFEHLRIVVDKGQELLRIDKFLMNRLEHTSRSRIQATADSGNILVNEKPVKSNYRVKPGDAISIVFAHPPRDKEIIPEAIPLNIVFEDSEFVIIHKPAGMVVHPGHGNYSGTLVNALMYHFQSLDMFKGLDPRPGLVHRLDKDTSGIMVLAKSEIAMSHLARQFFDRTTKRRYIALVWGDFKEDSGTITGHIGRDIRDRMQMAVFPDGSQGKHAITHWTVLQRFGYVTLVECRLETGRTHQIRAHMKYIGHPIFNDERYGGNAILKGTTFTSYKQFIANCFSLLPRQALHAKLLGFKHPVTGEYMEFDSELPSDMAQVLEKWNTYSTFSIPDKEVQ